MTENATCRWVNDNLEAYLFNDLPPDDRQRLDDHCHACGECSREVASHLEVEQLVQAAYRERLDSALAGRARSAPAAWRLGPAAAGMGIAAVLVLMVGFLVWTPGGDAIEQAGGQAGGADPEKTDAVAIERAKPEEALDGVPAALPADTSADGQEFSLEDPAGYLLSLDDLHGSALVIGVLTPDDVEAFRTTYERFRGTDGVRFIAVPLDPDEAVAGLPSMRNRGTSVLDTPPGGFVLVGPAGSVDGRGLVSDPEFSSVVESWIEDGVNFVRVE